MFSTIKKTNSNNVHKKDLENDHRNEKETLQSVEREIDVMENGLSKKHFKI